MILEFLGGAAFRALTGTVAQAWTKYQDHKHELEMMRLQNDLDQARAVRQMNQQRLAAELQVRTIEIQKDADIAAAEAEALKTALENFARPTGIPWVDGWNGSIRPAFATIVLGLWMSALVSSGFVLSEWDKELMGVVAGFFFADRQLRKSGK